MTWDPGKDKSEFEGWGTEPRFPGGVTANDLVETANTVGWALSQGIPVSQEDVQAFVWITMTHAGGELTDEEQQQIDFTPNEVRAKVQQRGDINNLSLQELGWIDTAMSEVDVAQSDETFNSIIAGVVQGGALPMLRGLYGSAVGRAAGSALSAGIKAPLAAGRFARSHKGITAVAGLGVMAGIMQGVGQETADNLIPYGEEQPGLTGDGSQFVIVDTQTGETIEIPQEEAVAAGLTNAPINGTTNGTATDIPQDIINFAEGMGVDPQAYYAQLQAAGLTGTQVEFNPGIAGDITLPYQTFQHGIDLSGQPLSELPSLLQPQAPPPGGFSSPQLEAQGVTKPGEYVDERQAYLQGLNVAPSGVIQPNAFRTWSDGRTLLQIASEAAADFGVPVEVLYGMVTQESGWNPYAVGDGGQSHGLVQIYQPAHPNITIQQSNNPVFALRWAAQNLLSNYQRYGSWELAIIAHRSPVGAQYLSENGEFREALDQQYLSNIATYAMQSTLGNTIFGGQGSALSGAGVATAGPAAPPYRAPDRATLEEFVASSFEGELGRDVTPEEMESRVKELESLYRKAYSQSVRNFRGQSSTDVDPQAQFRRSLQESGEGQFHESTQERSSMHQYMGNIATILQGQY
jgi:hypothetical protein